MSILISFLSLVLSSVKLFYSQRLGIFLDVDPSPKMIIYAALPILIQLLFPLFSLILITSYLQEYVIFCIGIIMLANMIVLNLKCLKNKLYCGIQYLYDCKNENRKRWKKESDEIFNTAILTSWISPCTVWSNNNKFQSVFLIVNSIVTFAVLFFNIYFVALLSYYRSNQSPVENPTIIQCYRNQENISLR